MVDLSKVVRGQNDENRPQVLSKNNSMKKENTFSKQTNLVYTFRHISLVLFQVFLCVCYEPKKQHFLHLSSKWINYASSRRLKRFTNKCNSYKHDIVYH